jgi:preprotein translocase subunit SecE
MGSTWIVICGMVLMALLLFGVDLVFAKLFSEIGILEGL